MKYYKSKVVEERRNNLLLEDLFLDELKETLVEKEDFSFAVHVHVFYVDMIGFLVDYFNKIPIPFDLYVSIPLGIKVSEPEIEQQFHEVSNLRNIKIVRTPNRGRDIAPMLCTFREDLKNYTCFLHVHTKKSPHLKVQDVWCESIFAHLLQNKDSVSKILQLFAANKVGMVAPPPYFYQTKTGWMGNLAVAQSLIDRMDIDFPLKKNVPTVDFPQGSMFFSCYDYLKPLFDLNLKYEDFPEEPIKTDGTIAHAIERLFFLVGAMQQKNAVILYFDKVDYNNITLRDMYQGKYRKHLALSQVLTWIGAVLFLLNILLVLYISFS